MSDLAGVARVVIADDDADICSLVAIAVKKSGLELVEQVSDGTQAWRAVQAHVPDIVVLDVAMPGMTGLEVCRLIRGDPGVAEIYVLMLSAAVDDLSRQAGLDAGANEYLIKPFSPQMLSRRLANFAQRTVAPS